MTRAAPDLSLVALLGGVQARSRPLLSVARDALHAGASALLLAGAGLDTRSLMEVGRDLRGISRANGASLLIGDRVDVALAVGADGVHLERPATDSVADWRLVGPEHRAIGGTVADGAEALGAALLDLDYLCVDVATAPAARPAGAPSADLAGLADVLGAAELTVLARGDFTPDTAIEAVTHGASGLIVPTAGLAPGAVLGALGRLRVALTKARAIADHAPG